MTLLIGTDEAGYGPNLGPLVIGASVWRVPDALADGDLYDLLASSVQRAACTADRLAIADSKTLYQPGGDLSQLERGVLGSLQAAGQRVTCWQDICRAVALEDAAPPGEAPCDQPGNDRLPLHAEAGEIARAASVLAHGTRQIGARLEGLYANTVFPARFNQLVEQHDSKGAALSLETLHLVKRLVERFSDPHVIIQCDKHGGRNHYGGLLLGTFRGSLPQVVTEGRASSVYRWRTADVRIEIRFVAKGESFLPSALASMTAKYLRELAMRAFNAFWQQHLPGLKPTAGYPLDARRFKREIANVQSRLGIEDRLLWRVR